MTPVWLVLPDPFSSRLFFDTGIVDRLSGRVGDRLELFLEGQQNAWVERAAGMSVTRRDELVWAPTPIPEKVWRRADAWLDRKEERCRRCS